MSSNTDPFIESDVIEPDVPVSSGTKTKKASKSQGNYSSIGSDSQGPSASAAADAGVSSDATAAVVNEIIADANLVTRGTLDETVLETVKRDVFEINSRLKQVVYPHFPSSYALPIPGAAETAGAAVNVDDTNSHSSDLWAPLTFVISYSLIVSHAQSLFSSLFITCWALLLVMALHLKLTKPHQPMSLISYISLSGYCLFPLVLQALLTQILLPLLFRLIIRNHTWQIRVLAVFKLILISICLSWSTTAISLVTNSKGVVQVYPLILCLFGLAWLSISL